MKKFTFLKPFFLFSIVCLGIFLFQAQQAPEKPEGWDDVKYDRVPWSVLHTPQTIPPGYEQPFATVGPDYFEDFFIALTVAEGNNSINPNVPLQSISVFNASGTVGARGYTTTNGGFNFSNNPLTWGATNQGDPVVAHDSLGNVYFDNMTGGITGTLVAVSSNSGVTWNGVVPGNSGFDKNWIAAVQSGGPYTNYVYGTMTSGSGCTFMRSTNRGVSFTVTTSLSPHALPGAMPCVGPNGGTTGGSVYVVTNWGSSFAAQYTFFRSIDGGLTFATQSTQAFANVVGTIVGGRNSVENMRTRPYPFISADNSFGAYRGRLHLIYASNDPPGDGNKPDIFSRYSNDFGVTWSSAIKVNDDANPTTHHQWHPAMWCDKQTGYLFVNWMDSRNCPTNDSAEIWASFSTDGGQTFTTNHKINTAKFKIDCISCGGGGTPKYLGDYNGVSSYNGIALHAWTDFRNSGWLSHNGYHPDWAMRTSKTVDSMNAFADTNFIFVSVPGVKSYTRSVRFTPTISPAPGTGTITLTMVNKISNTPLDSLTTYPDSLRLRIITAGGVTNQTYVINVLGQGPGGIPRHQRNINLIVNNVFGIEPISNELPSSFYLYQNYPNPFNPATNIRFDLAKSGHVKLVVYDITGKEVARLADGVYNAGKYEADFNASNFSSGVYFYKIETPDFVGIKKMILIK